MNWELVVWGLLLGMAGMIWMMVLAVGSDETPRSTEEDSSGDTEEESSMDRQARTPAA